MTEMQGTKSAGDDLSRSRQPALQTRGDSGCRSYTPTPTGQGSTTFRSKLSSQNFRNRSWSGYYATLVPAGPSLKETRAPDIMKS